MIELFTNPGYLAAGVALISAPIIIHLINRMRFKRLRWAAMEFLLKAQKRSRRRLIIEQLLLLLLRCLLVALAALLVLRFTGFNLAGLFGAQKEKTVPVRVPSDSRREDWVETPAPKPVRDLLLGLVQGENAPKVQLLDVAFPLRENEGDAPTSHNNVAVVDVRAGTRLTGRGM